MKKIKELKAIARFDMDQASLETIKELFSKKLITFADCNLIMAHKLQFLLYHHVMNIKNIKFEKNFGKQLSGSLVFLQYKYEEYLEFIKDIVKFLDENSILYCFVKGFSIIDYLYKDKGVIYRDFGDIDILINKKDVKLFCQGLQNMGFIQGYLDDNYKLKEADRKEIIYWRLNSHQEQSFIRKSRFSDIAPMINCRVDINTTIFEGGMFAPPISTEELLISARSIEIGNGIRAKSLSHELELIQLCYHLYKDIVQEEIISIASYTLIKFTDIREYIKIYYEVFDVEKLLNYINSNGIGNQIYAILKMVSDFYGDLFIDHILDRIEKDENHLPVPDWTEVMT